MGGLRAVGEGLARAAGLGGRPFLPRARAWVARPRVEGRGSWRPGAVPEGTKGLALALVRCPQPTSGSEMPFACVAKRRLVVVIPLQASRSQSLRVDMNVMFPKLLPSALSSQGRGVAAKPWAGPVEGRSSSRDGVGRDGLYLTNSGQP